MRGSEVPDREKVSGDPQTCSTYREEMRLLGLKRSLAREPLAETERRRLAEEIGRLEIRLGMA